MRVGRPPLADLGGEATGVLCVEAAALCPAPVGHRGRVPHMEARFKRPLLPGEALIAV